MSDEREEPTLELPSVGIPLLREEVEAAARKRRLILGGVLFLICVIVAGVLFVPAGDPEEAAGNQEGGAEAAEAVAAAPPNYVPPESLYWNQDGTIPEPAEDEVVDAGVSTAVPSSEAPVHASATVRSEARFGDARAFRQALQNAGLQPAEFLAIEDAVRDVLDFRRCRTDDQLYFERNGQGQLVRFEYHQEPTQYVVATRQPDGTFAGRMHQREIERIRLERGGRVRSSLGEALDRAGLGSSLVGVFVEVFDGKMNFSTGAREGDTFRVILDEERIDGEFLRYATPVALEYVSSRAGRLRAYYYEMDGRGDWYDEAGRAIRGGWLRVPCQYERISSLFDPHRMHPILRRVHPHNGVDFAAATGTPLRAAADGTVTWAGPKGPNGNLVSIRHANGYESHYAHMHQIQRGISPGVEVTQRQLIGTVGTTGRSTGPHLHFGLKHHGRFVDPLPVLNGPGQLLPARHRARFRQEARRLERRLAAIETGGDPVVDQNAGSSPTLADAEELD